MKKRLVLFLTVGVFAVLVIACGEKKETQTGEEEDDTYSIRKTEGPSSEQQIAEGKTLVDAADCRTCHHPTNKIIGPSHTEVAQKYEFTEANVKLLASKIIQGGSGVWGDVMMNPHPTVTQIEAEKMARYVLSLDGEKEQK